MQILHRFKQTGTTGKISSAQTVKTTIIDLFGSQRQILHSDAALL
ncbi:MAG: hypothetical protein WA364_23315 [Candidatus Nitrosopolaris sp.]|jgi:hypothetical protein